VCGLDFGRYPFDTHECNLRIGSAADSEETMVIKGNRMEDISGESLKWRKVKLLRGYCY
jgi:hypothetical protein